MSDNVDSDFIIAVPVTPQQVGEITPISIPNDTIAIVLNETVTPALLTEIVAAYNRVQQGVVSWEDVSGKPPFGSAALSDIEDFLNSDQGALVLSALQPGDIGLTVQPLIQVLTASITFYVDTAEGDDLNSGLSADSAFVSLSRALEELSLLDANGNRVTILFKGDLLLDEAFVLTAPNRCDCLVLEGYGWEESKVLINDTSDEYAFIVRGEGHYLFKSFSIQAEETSYSYWNTVFRVNGAQEFTVEDVQIVGSPLVYCYPFYFSGAVSAKLQDIEVRTLGPGSIFLQAESTCNTYCRYIHFTDCDLWTLFYLDDGAQVSAYSLYGNAGDNSYQFYTYDGSSMVGDFSTITVAYPGVVSNETASLQFVKVYPYWSNSLTLSYRYNKYLIHKANAGGLTVLVPSTAAVPLPIGYTITIVKVNEAPHSIVAAAGVTIDGTAEDIVIHQVWQSILLTMIDTDQWITTNTGAGGGSGANNGAPVEWSNILNIPNFGTAAYVDASNFATTQQGDIAELAYSLAQAAIPADGNLLPLTSGKITSHTYTVESLAPDQVIYSLDAALYRSVKFLVQIRSQTGAAYSTEIICTHDDEHVYLTEYSTLAPIQNLADFDADLVGGLLRLRASPHLEFLVITILVQALSS